MAVALLDVNVLIALSWPTHEDNPKVLRWISQHAAQGWATCPFTQAAFVRIISNPSFSSDALRPADALTLLERNVEGVPGHEFWPDQLSLAEAVKLSGQRLVGHNQVTDAYLVGLAIHRTGKVVTLDQGIAGWAKARHVEVIS